jgi:ATP:cob(I)alamin adenosyltransferase
MVRIYTKRGDLGETSLYDGTKVRKDDPRIILNGTLDEVTCALGIARSKAPSKVSNWIAELQAELIEVMAYIARGKADKGRVSSTELERRIDHLISEYPFYNKFVLPGDDETSAALHLARAFARRAERVGLKSLESNLIDGETYRYLNRLSDYIYALAVSAYWESTVRKITKLVVTKMNKGISGLNAQRARELIDEGRRKAQEIGVPMAMAVCDSYGFPIAFERMEGVLQVSLGLAPKKASTAIKLKMSTEALSRLVQPGKDLYGLQNDPELVVFGGGLLLKDGAEIVGAVGVSGGSVEQDISVAEAMVRAWER